MKTFFTLLCLVLLWCATAVMVILAVNPIRIAQMRMIRVHNQNDSAIRVALVGMTEDDTLYAPQLYLSRVPIIPAFNQNGILVPPSKERKIFFTVSPEVMESELVVDEVLVSIGKQIHTVPVFADNSAKVPNATLPMASTASIEARNRAGRSNLWLIVVAVLIGLLTPILTRIVVWKRWKADEQPAAIPLDLLMNTPVEPLNTRRPK